MSWRRNIEEWHRAVTPFTSELPNLEIGPIASKAEIAAMEQTIGKRCPDVLHHFMVTESCHINFWWHLRDGVIPIDVREPPYSGYIEFNIPTMSNINEPFWERGQPWSPHNIDQWERAFVFMSPPNGDSIALDIVADSHQPPVIYLNHEEPESVIRLAGSFGEFLESFSLLGFVGPEHWILEHFLDGQGICAQLKADLPNAAAFRRFFGLEPV